MAIDNSLVLSAELNKNGANIHTLQNLLWAYKNLFTRAKKKGWNKLTKKLLGETEKELRMCVNLS